MGAKLRGAGHQKGPNVLSRQQKRKQRGKRAGQHAQAACITSQGPTSVQRVAADATLIQLVAPQSLQACHPQQGSTLGSLRLLVAF